MNRCIFAKIIVALAALAALPSGTAFAAIFNYHGTLQDAGKPAEGPYDLELTLYSAASGGAVIGGPLGLHQVSVQGGSFNTQVDFGPLSTIVGTAWLGVRVRPAGTSDFAALSGRTPVSADATASVCPGAWTLDGNAGNAPGSYLGTADGQPLVIKTFGQVMMTIGVPELNTDNDIGTNIVSGYSTNSIGAQAVGGTIAGGGGILSGLGDQPNRIETVGSFSAIGGGLNNDITGKASVVAGGESNLASGAYYSVVSGGKSNKATQENSMVAGGVNNTAAGISSSVAGGEGNTAVELWSAVAGGRSNSASGVGSMASGGQFNLAGGDYSFAAGSSAHVRSWTEVGGGNVTGDQGTFIWADDSSSTEVRSMGPNQFLVRATGGVGINALPINNVVELTIAGSGNGGDFANAFLHQAGSNAGIMISSGSATTTANNDAVFLVDRYNGTTQGHDLSIAANGDFQIYSATAIKPTGTTWSNPSDVRLKRDVRPLEGSLDQVLRLRGVTFEYANPDDYLHPAGRHTGFIAQEVQQVFPDWIGSTPDGYLTVGPNGFEALTVEALRDLRAEKDAEISALQDRLAEAAARNAAIETRLNALAARLSRLEAAAER